MAALWKLVDETSSLSGFADRSFGIVYYSATFAVVLIDSLVPITLRDRSQLGDLIPISKA